MINYKTLIKCERVVAFSLFPLILIFSIIKKSVNLTLGFYWMGTILFVTFLTFNLTFFLLYRFKTNEGKDSISIFYRFGLLAIFAVSAYVLYLTV